MQIFDELEWTGRAWPAASIIGRARVVYKDAGGLSRKGTGEVLDIDVSGRGREYELRGPAAFWRSFVEFDFGDPNKVLAFLRRRGAPFDDLAPGAPIDTGPWSALADLMRPAAACWTDSRMGPSVNMGGYLEKREAAERLIASPLIRDGLDYRPYVAEQGNRIGVRVIAKSLAAFMATSALAQLETKPDMAVCKYCLEWFEQRRRDSNYCSASCRSLHSASKKGQ